MLAESADSRWDLYPAISLLSLTSKAEVKPSGRAKDHFQPTVTEVEDTATNAQYDLGNFTGLWDFLKSAQTNTANSSQTLVKYKVNDCTVAQLDVAHLNKAVKWRDEVDGADLEDNVEPVKFPASNLRTQKRAARRARAREKAKEVYGLNTVGATSDTGTDVESGEELESLRRSPDRRSLIAELVGRPRPTAGDASSPPSSPSPPKPQPRTPVRDWPVSNPFLWTISDLHSTNHRLSITPRDGLTPTQRKLQLIQKLTQCFPEEKKYLRNSGLTEPAFTPMNTSDRGIHVFIDMSNISIGFNDCLKDGRGINRETRVRRVPMNFHNLSLILERGRPAAKRVLAGSDRNSSITEAMSLGYEANMLERVHKAKELTPRQKKEIARRNYNNGNTSASGPGETSGSETNNGYLSSGPTHQQAKWVEQAVDEILHMKILESLVDNAKEPSTIVLATGDAAEAEYSGGFLHQVQRALANGWVVEVVSFSKNTSSLYTKTSFRQQWGPMFKLVPLDPYVEFMIEEELKSHI